MLFQLGKTIVSKNLPEKISAIEAQGTLVKGTDGDLETPLIDHKDCAYIIFEAKTAISGIEQAYN